MTMALTTSATDEPIEPGKFCRMVHYTCMWPTVIERITPRGAVVVRPMLRDGTGWDKPRKVDPDTIWYLLTPKEVKAADLPKKGN